MIKDNLPLFCYFMDMIRKPWWQDAVNMFAKLSGWVILPLIVGYTLGRWLDNRHDSSPKWFLICVGISFIISMIGLVRQAKQEYIKIDIKEKK